MDLEFVKSVVRKSHYENDANQVKEMKLPTSINLELIYPNSISEGTQFLIVNRVFVGNPVQKFSLYLEQVCSFRIVNLEPGFDTSRENMQKFISTICHPVALRELQHAMDSLTSLYQINAIQLPTNTRNAKPADMRDLPTRGLPN